MPDDKNAWVSDQLVRLVQIVFALVLAQSLFLFRGVVTHPLEAGNRVATLALVAVFTTTVLSWVDWHTTMVFSPYLTRERPEKMRLFADLLVVIAYAYLLFSVEPLVGHPQDSVLRHLAGYPLAFIGYVVSGVTRRRTYGAAASRLYPIRVFLGLYTVLWLSYWLVWSHRAVFHSGVEVTINVVSLSLVITLMIIYRLYRARYRDRQRARKAGGLVVGVDVDGVLADQITGVLARLRERYGIALTYDDITHWRLPTGPTNIAAEIERALADRQYVVRMPVHRGARRLLRFLYDNNHVVVVTARTAESREWTREWLNRNLLSYDRIEASTEAKKSAHRINVLIDDYLGNVLEFLENTDGAAVLVDQPWNRERENLQIYLRQRRLVVVQSLRQIEAQWSAIDAAARAGRLPVEEGDRP